MLIVRSLMQSSSDCIGLYSSSSAKQCPHIVILYLHRLALVGTPSVPAPSLRDRSDTRQRTILNNGLLCLTCSCCLAVFS